MDARNPVARAFFPFALLAGASFALAAQEEQEVLVTEGTNFAVTAAPEEGPLFLDLQGTLWRMPRAGGEAEALTDGYGDDRIPHLHPDGSRLVFQSFRSGTWDIWMLPAGGGEAERLTTGPYDDREPVFSPDGERIAFSSDRSGSYDIWVLEIESGTLTPLTTSIGNEYWPAWTPDGGLVFVSEPEGGEAELRHLPAEGGDSRPVPGSAGAVVAPAVSPDGSRVAFRRLRREELTLMGSHFDLGIGAEWVVASLREESEEEPRVLEGAGADIFPFRPVWLDEQTLLYSGDGGIQRLGPEGEVETVAFSARLGVVRPPTPKGKVRTGMPGRQPVHGIIRPTLSPDGTRVLYAALGDLWVAPLDGSEAPLPLTRDSFLDTDPVWLPDGSGVIFASDRRGTMDLWEKSVDSAPGAGLVQITSGLGAEVSPALSPDGERVAWLDEAGNLWVGPRDADEAAVSDEQALYRARRGAGMPSWSADGATIAVAALSPFSTRFREGWNRIALVAADSGETRLLGLEGSIGSRESDGPVFSPDGRAFALAFDGGLAVVPFDGSDSLGEPRRIFEGPVDFLSWAPDGGSLLALSGADLVRIHADGGGFETIPLRHEYSAQMPSGSILFQNVGVLDVDAGEVRPAQDVLVDAGRIVSVNPTGETPAEDMRVVPGEGATLIPGLIEMHTHPAGSAFGNRFGRVHLAYGVTTVRITAGHTYRTLEERESILAGRRVGPRVFLTGSVLDGDRIYYPGAIASRSERAVDSILQLAEALDFDVLKTYVRLDDQTQAEAIRRARRIGAFVTSHELYPAVRSGIHGIEHIKGTSRRGFSPKVSDLGYSYGDVRSLIVESGAFWVPTLLIYGGWDLALARDAEAIRADRRMAVFPPWIPRGIPDGEGMDETSRLRLMEPMWSTVHAAWREGARVIMGTDTPIIPYGIGLVLEVEQFSEAGPGPAAAIRASTRLAAEALGLEDELGAIQPGMLADLVLLDGDPLEDIRNLRKVRAVMWNGRLATLDQLLGF